MRRRRSSAVVEREEEEEELGFDDDEEEEERSMQKKKTRGKKAAPKKRASRGRGTMDDFIDEDEDEEETPRGRGKKKGVTKKAAPKKRTRGDDEEDEDEDVAAVAGTAVERKFNLLSEAERKLLVSNVVRLLLLRHRERTKVQMGDVSKFVLIDAFAGMKISRELLKHAADLLENLFGLELVEEDKIFFLRNSMKLEDPFTFMQWDDPGPISGLAALLVGMIHTKRPQKMDESDLYAALLPLGFHEERMHPVFGKWEDVIKKICTEQKYLIRKKEKDAHGDPIITYTPGPRIKVEADLYANEAFVSKIYGRAVDPEKLKELATERGEGEEKEKEKERKERPTRRTSSAAKRRRKGQSDFDDDSE